MPRKPFLSKLAWISPSLKGPRNSTYRKDHAARTGAQLDRCTGRRPLRSCAPRCVIIASRPAPVSGRPLADVNTPDEEPDPGVIGRRGQIAAGVLFALLALTACATAVVATTESFASKPEGRLVAVVFFGAIGVVCSWFAIRLLLNQPRPDGGLMPPLGLRATAAFFMVLPVVSLATGAWRNNSIPLPLVLAQSVLHWSWGVALLRLAVRRDRRSSSFTHSDHVG